MAKPKPGAYLRPTAKAAAVCTNCAEPITRYDMNNGRSYWTHNLTASLYCRLPALIANPQGEPIPV